MTKKKNEKLEKKGKEKPVSVGTSEKWLARELEKEKIKDENSAKLARKKELQGKKKKLAEEAKKLQQEIKSLQTTKKIKTEKC